MYTVEWKLELYKKIYLRIILDLNLYRPEAFAQFHEIIQLLIQPHQPAKPVRAIRICGPFSVSTGPPGWSPPGGVEGASLHGVIRPRLF